MPTAIIGITTRKDLTRAGLPAVMVQQVYVNAILQAGGAPVLIPSDLPEAGWRELYQRLDGILFTGGGDIATQHFNGQAHPKVANVDEARDFVELGLARSAAEDGKAFLGICRGLQLVNVALSGTLYTDIPEQIPNALNHNWQDPDVYKERTHLAHSVRVRDGSRAGEILGETVLQVNSLHHQGIKELATGLKATAHAPDGIIEAIELPGHPFGIAVQWHPEWLLDQQSARQLFKAFVDAAGEEQGKHNKEKGKENSEEEKAECVFAPSSLICHFIKPMSQNSPIGIFDSGVGGLSVLRTIRALMPEEEVIYLGDQQHVPYGPRPLDEVRAFSEEITRFLLARGAKLILVACNSASAAALPYLREHFPDVPFVGMEPAVKSAVEHTRSGVVGVLATPATFQGALYASILERFARDVTVLEHTCPGLVEQIEKGALEAAETESILREALLPMLEQGLDAVVLGCSHYPFVIPLIQPIIGQHVRVIDPAPAVARQVARLLDENGLRHPPRKDTTVTYYTTAADGSLERLLPILRGEIGTVKTLRWEDGKLLDKILQKADQ